MRRRCGAVEQDRGHGVGDVGADLVEGSVAASSRSWWRTGRARRNAAAGWTSVASMRRLGRGFRRGARDGTWAIARPWRSRRRRAGSRLPWHPGTGPHPSWSGGLQPGRRWRRWRPAGRGAPVDDADSRTVHTENLDAGLSQQHRQHFGPGGSGCRGPRSTAAMNCDQGPRGHVYPLGKRSGPKRPKTPTRPHLQRKGTWPCPGGLARPGDGSCGCKKPCLVERGSGAGLLFLRGWSGVSRIQARIQPVWMAASSRYIRDPSGGGIDQIDSRQLAAVPRPSRRA